MVFCTMYTKRGLIFRESGDKGECIRKLTKKDYVEILRNNSKITDEKIVNFQVFFPVINTCGYRKTTHKTGAREAVKKLYNIKWLLLRDRRGKKKES